MQKNNQNLFEGTIISDDASLTLVQLGHALATEHDFITELVEHACIQPVGEGPEDWRFDSICLKRAKLARSFYFDLEVNIPGVVLALELMAQLETFQNT